MERAAAGGTVEVPPREIPGVGTVAYIVEPGGVRLGLHQPE